MHMTEEEYQKLMERRKQYAQKTNAKGARKGKQDVGNSAVSVCNLPTTTREICASEHVEQVKFVNWLKSRGIRYAATPNGGKRHLGTARKLKAEGVTAGFPDITIFPFPNAPCQPVLYIEMKREKGGRVSEAQQDWIDYIMQLNRMGYLCRVQVCHGFEAARAFAQSWGY